MPKCDYCHEEIIVVEKFLLRLITPNYEFREKWYHLECFFKLLEDEIYLSKLQAEFLIEIQKAITDSAI